MLTCGGVALPDAMKNDGVSVNIADSGHRAMSGTSEHSVTELASALAMMHATLESTTDAVLVTDEANYVREFHEKYVTFWGIPPHMLISAHASELWNYVSPQLKNPAGIWRGSKKLSPRRT